ncbi:alpha beta-hydrolase [Diplodia corticola]|uniref:Carboxylic ester hydrolase n=1 Tax=Diplodia corticola TaxID=236234 RepID=A0A1J9S263_9PEZI|nr:alpha beta-hydrolase [Diplodia corticola]OJD34663.1 alpha beta-hydrolase [Diplodia corticola]
MRYGYGAILLAAAEAALAAPATRRAAAPVASVKNGTIEGVHNPEYNQDFFLGLPFAQPPVGELRFRVPQPLNTSFAATWPATDYAPSCIGYGSDQFGYEISEDCLYLNVVKPAGYENQSLPVAFWIHGGGFYEGGAGDHRYNLSFIVQNGVEIGKPFIAVSTNYRLSAWGFLNGDAVQASGNTNLGLRDQRLALHWVQENIAAFGGDPDKVTIFGESAGGCSVGFHLTAYNGRDDTLFRGAIMESGSPIYYTTLNESAAFQPRYDTLISQAGCSNSTDSLACLRSLSYDDLNAVINQTALLNWGPAIDHDFIAGKTSDQLVKGDFVQVPIIIGANSDEGVSFGPQGINSSTDFVKALQSTGIPSNFTSTILAAYPDIPAEGIPGSPPLGFLPPDFRYGAPEGPQYRRSAAYYGDQYFVGNRRLTCERWAEHGVPAYCFRFNAIPNGATAAAHFQEVAFVFDNILGTGYNPPISSKPFENRGQSYVDLAKFMSSSWASFFVDLDPNGYNLQGNATVEQWTPYDIADPKDIVFHANVTSYMEPDTYRAAGMKLFKDYATSVYSR